MSKYTAITRKKPSLPAEYLYENGYLAGSVLDYGCGRGFDADFYGLDKYDLNWFPRRPLYYGAYDVVMCNFVLNVVTEDVQMDILYDVYNYLKLGGVAYFAVRRDISKDTPGRGCVQRLVTLPFNSLYFKKRAFEIYRVAEIELNSFLTKIK